MNAAPIETTAPRAAVVRFPADQRPILTCVIDTEEEWDWAADFDRRNTGVTHMRNIGALQAVFDEFGIRPVYVVDYPVATQRDGFAPLTAIHAAGKCEIGAHLHPWVTPPFDEEVNRRNSYPGNLPRGIELGKLTELVRAIESNMHVRPRSYKAGRYGFGPNTLAILEDLGFEVDLSPCPPFDFGEDGGPDYSGHPSEPQWLAGRSRLLCVPATGAYVGFVKAGAHGLYRFATRPALMALHVPGILARTGVLERLHLSPEGHSFEENRRLTLALHASGARSFTFCLHSPSVMPGCTPYVSSDSEAVEFLDSCRRYFEFFFRDLGGESMTALELKHYVQKHSLRDSL